MIETIPPWDENAETAVLGSCFIDPTAIGKIPFLQPADFYREKNQWIFAAMLELSLENKPTDQILVAHKLATKKLLDAMGGADYISYCIDQTPTSVFVVYYAEIVKDCSERRGKLQQAAQLQKEAYSQQKSNQQKGGIDLTTK